MTVAYLCGPISTGGTASAERIQENLKAFERVKEKFSETSTKVNDPSTLPPQGSWPEYMKLSVPMLCEADFMILLPGWEHSRGAIFEIMVANTLNIPIIFAEHL